MADVRRRRRPGCRGDNVSRIDDYLRQIEPLLPRAARRRLLAEITGHLGDATEAFKKRGLATDEAEQRALADFGSPELIAGRCHESTGGLFMSSTLKRWSPAVGAVLMAPAVVFLFANLLRYNLGQPWLHDAMSLVIEPRTAGPQALLDATIALGPLLALATSALSILRLSIKREERRWSGTVTVELSAPHLAVVLLGVAVIATIAGYVIGENLECIAGVQAYC